jgi:hypothetical protein
VSVTEPLPRNGCCIVVLLSLPSSGSTCHNVNEEGRERKEGVEGKGEEEVAE